MAGDEDNVRRAKELIDQLKRTIVGPTHNEPSRAMNVGKGTASKVKSLLAAYEKQLIADNADEEEETKEKETLDDTMVRWLRGYPGRLDVPKLLG